MNDLQTLIDNYLYYGLPDIVQFLPMHGGRGKLKDVKIGTTKILKDAP